MPMRDIRAASFHGCGSGLLPNQPLQPSGTRLQAGGARRAGSRQRLNGGVRRRDASEKGTGR